MSRGNRKRDCVAQEAARRGIVSAGTPAWITAELIERTIQVWHPFYAEVLTPEAAVTMIQSVGRLYSALSSETSR